MLYIFCSEVSSFRIKQKGGCTKVSIYMSVIRLLVVYAISCVLALTIHTLLTCYQLVQPVLATGISRAAYVLIWPPDNACKRSLAIDCRLAKVWNNNKKIITSFPATHKQTVTC